MACSLIKKGLLGATLSAGALYLAFGTDSLSYVWTAFHKVRDNAKSSVPVQFEIDRVRGEINNLEPTIKRQHREASSGADVEVEHLDREIVDHPGQPGFRMRGRCSPPSAIASNTGDLQARRQRHLHRRRGQR